MTRTGPSHEFDYEDFAENDSEIDSFEGEFEDEVDTVACSSCGSEIYEQAERCPHCGLYVLDSEQSPTQRPSWVVWTAIALLIALIYWSLFPSL